MEEQPKQPKSDVKLITETALKTVYWLVVISALLLVIFYVLFPSVSASVYEDFGDYYKAYDCADRAYRTGKGESKVNSALDKVNYSAIVFDSDKTFANEVEESTESFLADEKCLARIPLIDEYNQKNSAKSMRPNLYSYKDYLYSLNAKARATKGKTDFLYGGKYIGANELLTKETTAFDSAIILSQIATAISVTGKTDFVDLTALVEKARQVLTSAQGESDALKELYLVKAYEKIYVRLATQEGVSKDVKESLKSVTYGGQAYEITDLYYNKLLANYCK